MISKEFQIILIITMILNLIITIYYIRKMEMRVKYALIWIFISLFMLTISVFPKIFTAISNFLNIYNDANALFMLAIIFLYVLSFNFSIILSRNSKKIKTLIQHIALLNDRVDDLENKNNKLKKN